MNMVIIGDGAAGIQTLRTISRTGCRVVAVLTSPPSQQARAASLWGVAQESGHCVWPAEMVKDPRLADRLAHYQTDIIINIYDLSIIHRDVLSAVRVGCFNVHPGPLPRYAGLNSMCWAIYRGEKTHGVTIHEIVPTVDAGPIVFQSLFPIDDEETGLQLATKCIRVGVSLTIQLLEAAIKDPRSIPRIPQDLSKREYFGRTVPQGGRLNWQRPARQIVNFIRACDFFPFPSPWGTPRTTLGDQWIGIGKASGTGQPVGVSPGSVETLAGSKIRVACADEWILVHRLLIDGRHIPPAEVLKTGDRFV
jgi:methionyl-tRNA formyltransferase